MRFLLCLVGLGFLSSSANAELIYVAANSVYTQNFDTLASSGTDLAWNNGTTLSGWYSSSNLITAAPGDASDETLYSFGSNGSSDRALGIVSEGGVGAPQFAVAIRNESGTTLNSINIAFEGEQWRRSNTNIPAPQTLEFGYRTSASLGGIDSGAYTNVAGLAFTSPGYLAPFGPVDGNNSSNRSSNISSSLTGLDWKQGEYLWLRWENEINGVGSIHGLGIDNFSFSASTSGDITAVPEPSSLLLLSAVGVVLYLNRKRRRIDHNK